MAYRPRYGKTKGRKPKSQLAPRKPFRDLDKDGVTYTFLAQWLGCRESARLAYVEGLSKSGMAEALEFGSAVHHCLERLADGTIDRDSPDPTAELALFARQRLAQMGKLSSRELGAFKRLMAVAGGIFPLYCHYWQQKGGIEFDPNAEFVYHEKSFIVDHVLPSGRVVKLRGRWDGVFRNSSGKLWILEHKTRSFIDAEGITSYLPHDLQTMMYVHALQLHLQQETGCWEEIEGVVFDVIKRPGFKHTDKETLEEHVERVIAAVAEKRPEYFMRWHVTFSPGSLEDWLTSTLNPILQQVCDWWDSIKADPFNPHRLGSNPLHYTNPEHLYTKYGRSEYFEKLTRGSDYGLRRRSQ